jgi:hypothetical protein
VFVHIHTYKCRWVCVGGWCCWHCVSTSRVSRGARERERERQRQSSRETEAKFERDRDSKANQPTRFLEHLLLSGFQSLFS